MNTYRNLLALLILTLALCGASATHAAGTVFEAYVPKIDNKHLYLDSGEKFPMAAESTPFLQRMKYKFTTECYTEQNHRITCETILGVGYIDRARITIENGAVKVIRVIELQQ